MDNRPMIYLVLATMWLTLVVLAFSQGWVIPITATTSIPMGWAALALFAYNMTRWWMDRQQRNRGLPHAPTPPRRVEGEKIYNPDFDFSDPDEGKKEPHKG